MKSLRNEGERNKKALSRKTFFHFRMCETFGDVEIDFSTIFTNVLEESSVISKLHYFLCKFPNFRTL